VKGRRVATHLPQSETGILRLTARWIDRGIGTKASALRY
jgi:hypothetical protein